MKKIWKWILGIAIVLVVLVAVGFAAHGFFVSRTARAERFENFRPPTANGFDNRQGPSFGNGRFQNPRGDFSRRLPMFGGRGFGGYGFMFLPLMFFGGFLRLIIPLAILAAVGYFAYKKGKKDGMAAMASAPTPEPVDVPEVDKPAEQPKRRGKKVAKED